MEINLHLCLAERIQLLCFVDCFLILTFHHFGESLNEQQVGTCPKINAYHLGEIVDRTESDENPLIPPKRRYEERSLVPYGADVVPELPRCCDVIVRRWYRHLYHLLDLQRQPGLARTDLCLTTSSVQLREIIKRK